MGNGGGDGKGNVKGWSRIHPKAMERPPKYGGDIRNFSSRDEKCLVYVDSQQRGMRKAFETLKFYRKQQIGPEQK